MIEIQGLGHVYPDGTRALSGVGGQRLQTFLSLMNTGTSYGIVRSLPVDTLSSAGIALKPPARRRGAAAEMLATAFRALPVPVIGRIKDGAFMLDLRCLDDEAGFIAQLDQLSIETP